MDADDDGLDYLWGCPHPPYFPPVRAELRFETASICARNVHEYFFRLVSRQANALWVDGHKLVHVQTMDQLDDKRITRVICEADDGILHEFIYRDDDCAVVRRSTQAPEPGLGGMGS